MPPPAKVHHRATAAVLILVRQQAVTRRAHVAAKGKRRASELTAQTYVECHVGVVGVHIEA
eukprot:scaffold111470_cov31-Tisochrysis_lutea.AAC.3